MKKIEVIEHCVVVRVGALINQATMDVFGAVMYVVVLGLCLLSSVAAW